jgi:hypothetical protein
MLCAVRVNASRSNMHSPAAAVLAAVALALLVLGSSTADAKLTNVVTDWVNATKPMLLLMAS